jgi:hypothetical protein
MASKLNNQLSGTNKEILLRFLDHMTAEKSVFAEAPTPRQGILSVGVGVIATQVWVTDVLSS